MRYSGKAIWVGLLMLLVVGVVLAQDAPAISRWNIGGGGGVASGGNVVLHGALGQGIAGPSSGGSVALQAGFWTGGPGAFIYLPLVLRDYIAYFEGPWEQEPNNNALQANGPLRSGRDYYGYPNDDKDYFSIYMRTGGTITIDLTNHTGQGVQLQLFYQTPGNVVEYDLTPPYHITYTGPAGWYYIYIYTANGYNSTTPYTLRVTYP
jgi:hypothetical protein